MDWDKLRVFQAVAMIGNFRKASELLNISQSAVGRQVSILEGELGVPLFKRVTKGVTLTEEGTILQESVLRVSARLDAVQATLVDLKTQPFGPLHIVTSLSFGSLWVAPRLQAFQEKYPEIQMTLTLQGDEEAFSLQDADIGITALPLLSPDLVRTTPLPGRFRIYASRSYLDRHGVPKSLEDLSSHHLVGLGDQVPIPNSLFNWIIDSLATQNISPLFMANTGQALYEAVKSGLGIGVLQRYIVQDDPELIEILTDLPPLTLSYSLVYPPHLRHLKRVETFVRFITDQMTQEEW